MATMVGEVRPYLLKRFDRLALAGRREGDINDIIGFLER
jgi:hypothetical protein